MRARHAWIWAAAMLCAACSSSSGTEDQGPAAADATGKTDAGGERDATGPRDGAQPADQGEPLTCPPVTVDFTGKAFTVVDNPLGLDDTVRNTDISGFFAYRPCVPDAEPEDETRGVYDHRGGGAFELSIGGKQVTGSENPVVETVNYSNATFRYKDGPQMTDEDEELRVMELDGVRHPSLTIWFSIVDGDGTALEGDEAPEVFPFQDIGTHVNKYPHTFKVEDEGGRVLLQLDTMKQR